MTVSNESGSGSQPPSHKKAQDGINNNANSGQTPNIKAQGQRPKSVLHWSVADVQKWLRRHCGDFYHLYCEPFLDQDITGRSLVRMNENSLMRLGVIHPEHRHFILREIGKLRLRSSILHLRDQERMLASTLSANIDFTPDNREKERKDENFNSAKTAQVNAGAADAKKDDKKEKKDKKKEEEKQKQDK